MQWILCFPGFARQAGVYSHDLQFGKTNLVAENESSRAANVAACDFSLFSVDGRVLMAMKYYLVGAMCSSMPKTRMQFISSARTESYAIRCVWFLDRTIDVVPRRDFGARAFRRAV